MTTTIDLGKFVSLRQQELESGADEIIENIERASQSIHRWLQYCQYHYFNLVNSTGAADLAMDRVSQYRRKGENVTVRYVYEANIIGFLNSLHALLDSFPYLLNLFIPKFKNPDSKSIRWGSDFVGKYSDCIFFDELRDLLTDQTFNMAKGYVNTSKHKHLIRIVNTFTKLEFEEFTYLQPVVEANNQVSYLRSTVPQQDAIEFVVNCHDKLIPKFFELCNKVISAKV